MTFTDTLARGKIIVDKVTDPSGHSQEFEFAPDWDSNFLLTDAATPYDSGDLLPGIYAVDEVNIPAGWTLTSAVCSDGSDPGAIDLGPGETVTVTFTDTKRGEAEVNKTTNGTCNPAIEWTFTLNGPEVDVTDTTDASCHVDFDGAQLIPGETYTICELGLPAGWTTSWSMGGTLISPAVDPITGDHCYDFSVGAGEKVTFTIDNIPPPGGEPRTPGYWKNWNRCSGGNQQYVADRNGGPEEGFWLVEDVLELGDMYIGGLLVDDCETAVSILDRRDVNSGKKSASDAAYKLAGNLLAAKLNYGAGACTDPDVTAAIAQADALLSSIGFDGTGNYLPPKNGNTVNRALALSLAEILDDYNNGEFCP